MLSLAVDTAALARIALCSALIWWILLVRRMLPRHLGAGDPGLGPARPARLLREGFGQLAATLRHMRGLPLTLAFLGAFLVYYDGIQTVTTVAAQYGDKELELSDTVVLLAILLVQFVAYAGAAGWRAGSGRSGSSPRP